MTYITVKKARTLAQMKMEDLEFDTDSEYEATVNDLIVHAQSIIDNFCDVPTGFFEAGGVTLTDEYHDLKRTNSYVSLRYKPVISITTASVDTAQYGSASSWSVVAEANRRVDLVSGALYFYNLTFYVIQQNIKVTYVAGYAATPGDITYVAGQLVANALHDALQRKVAPVVRIDDWAVRMSGSKIFTKELQDMLRRYKQIEASFG